MSFGPDGSLCVAVQDADNEQDDVWILCFHVDKEQGDQLLQVDARRDAGLCRWHADALGSALAERLQEHVLVNASRLSQVERPLVGVCPGQWSCPCSVHTRIVTRANGDGDRVPITAERDEYVGRMPLMRVSTLGFALAACLWLAAFEALAQPAPTVQLPTFSFAGVGTTVMVPDGGAAYLGGINRASDGRSEFGVPGITFPGFQNRGIGQDRSTSSFWVTATIHDFDAMDQALLNTPSPDGLARTIPSISRGLPETPAAIAGRTFQRNPANLAGNWRVEPDAPASRERRGGRAGQSGRLARPPGPTRPTASSPVDNRPRPTASRTWPRSTTRWPPGVPRAT